MSKNLTDHPDYIFILLQRHNTVKQSASEIFRFYLIFSDFMTTGDSLTSNRNSSRLLSTVQLSI